jgi:Spy/CpxP family protein refolding chaperone
MRPLLNRSVLALAVMTLTSAVAVAQTRPATPRPPRAGPPTAERDTMPGARRGPATMPPRSRMGGPGMDLIRMREQLELNDEQVKKLEALQSTTRPQLNQADMLRAQADLMDATKGDVNVEKARGAYERMARLRTDVQISQLKARQDVRNVLTPAQRTKADAMRASARDRRGAAMRKGRMRQGGMRQGGMRQGGMRQGGVRGPDRRESMRRDDRPTAWRDRDDRRGPGGPPAAGRYRQDGRDTPMRRRGGGPGSDTQPSGLSDSATR